jgi:hypothetical protein
MFEDVLPNDVEPLRLSEYWEAMPAVACHVTVGRVLQLPPTDCRRPSS